MEQVKLGDFCTITSSKRIFANQYVSNGIPFYRQKEIIERNNKQSISDPLFISHELYDEIKKKYGVPQKGDLLITGVGVTLGIPYLVGNETFYFKDGNLIWLKNFKQEFDSKYAYYFISSNAGQRAMWARTIGAAQPALTIDSVKRYKIPLPPYRIQKFIASILSTYDNLIENNNRRIRLLEQMAENLYKEWFVRFRFPGHEKVEMVNGLPKGWKYAKLEDILSLKDSARIPLSSLERSNMQKIYPYYGAASILDYVNDYLFDGVYLLLGEDGSVIDDNGYPYIQYVWGKFWVNNHAHVIEKKGVYSVEFLYCLFKRMNIQSIVTGVAQPKISQGRLFNKKVIKPSDSIISLFDKQIQPVFAGIRQLTEENKNLTRQRDLLLPRLMSGKLEVKE